jgi:hypothetical protein
MPDGPKIIDAETLAAKLGAARMEELVTHAKELQGRGKSVDEIATALRERFPELDDWLPRAVWFWLGR